MTGPTHNPVMVDQVVRALAPRPGGTYVDGTFGGGGYSRAILDAADCAVLAIDRDPDAIARGEALSRDYDGRLTLVEGRFGDMAALLRARAVEAVDGVAFDLGVSSFQLDDADRGFSFMRDGPLDMRMGRSGPNAADLVNEATERELADIIHTYGEDRASRQVARAIVSARAERPITRTLQLADIVRRAVPPARRREDIHPATRTFQALRIAVNRELDELNHGLEDAEALLAAGGRLAVVSFHSLEDRRVKNFLRARSGSAPRGSRHRPDAGPGRAPSFHLLFRRAAKPTADEIRLNARARSARLRAAERTDAPAWPSRVNAHTLGAGPCA